MAVTEIKVRIGLEGGQQVQAGAQAAGASMEKLGKSSGLAAYQASQLSAQLQDLFIQIQAGGNPLTALLQQGSQLSAVFGGTGNALKAVAAIITPTVATIGSAAAALGALAYGFTKGSEESAAFNRAVILSGQVAGVTAGNLSDMAAAVARLGGGTQGRAAEILTQMATAGQVGAANLAKFTDAALKLEKYGGVAASDTAKAFEELGRSPVEASRKLDASTNAFTESVLRQIKTLDQQGRSADAARLAQETYADTLNNRIPQLASQLGTVEKAWDGIKSATKGAIDQLLNFGRDDTLSKQVAQLEASAARLRAVASNQGVAQPGDLLRLAGGQSFEQQAAELEKIAAKLRESATTTAYIANQERERNQAKQAGLKFDEAGEQFLARSARYNREVTQAVVEGVAAGRSMVEIQSRIAAIQSKFDPGTTLQAVQGAEARKLELIKQSQARIDTLRQTGAINEINYIQQSTKLTVQAYDVRIEAAEKELKVLQAKQDTELQQAQKRDQIDLLRLERQGKIKAGEDAVTLAIYKQSEAAEALQRALDEGDKAKIQELIAAANATLKSLATADAASLQSIQDSNELLRLEIQLQGLSNEQRDAEIAKLRIRQQLIATTKQIEGLTGFVSDDQKAQFQANAASTAAKAIALTSAQASVAQWKRASEEINGTLTDALLKAFDDGKGAAQDMADAIKTIFRNMILKPVIQAIVQPVAGDLASLFGNPNSPASGQGATGMSGVGAVGSLYSAGRAAYGFFAGSGGAATNAAGSALGSEAAYYGGTAAGTGATSSAAGASSASYAGAYAAVIYALSTAAANDFRSGFNADSAKNINGILGPLAGTTTALNNVLTKLGISNEASSILSGTTLISKLFGYGRANVEGRNIVGSIGSGGFDGTLDIRTRQKGGLFRSDLVTTTSDAISGDIDRALDDASAKIRENAKKYGAALGLPVDQIDKVTKSINIDVTFASDAEIAQKIQDEMTSYSNSLLEGFADALGPIKNVGETVSQTIERVAGNLMQVNDVLGTLGLKLLDTSVAGGKSSVELANVFGGLQQFGQATGSYYANFYSDAEKSANASKQLAAALGTVGLKVPETRDAFRSLVEGLDLTTESGQQQFAVLIGVQQAFADLHPAIEATTVAARSASDVLRERTSLEQQLLQLQGNTTELRNRERAALDDSNKALYDQINALQDKQAADAAAAAQASTVNQQRLGLEQQLLQLQGNTTELRSRERAALDETNRSLYDAVAALQDRQAAEAAAAAQAATVSQQRLNLEQQLLQLQGNTTELRARERDALDASNRALYDAVAALQDKQAADQAAAARAATVGQQRVGLEQQLLQLQGNTTELRARERAALDDTNKSLYDAITALQDKQAADQAAATQAAAVGQQRLGLEQQLLQLQGNNTELRARERAALDATNRSLYDAITALQDKQAADQAAAAQAASVGQERLNLEQQLLQLQGNTAEIRARERAALDESNRSLYDQINALRDQAAAAQTAAAALTQINTTLANLGGTRFDLENQLLTLQGNGAEVLRRTRERDLAQLTAGLSPEDAARVTAAYDYNQSLRDQITATQQAQSAAQAYAQAQAQAAEQAAQAAAQLKQAWQGATDNIFQEVARIRGLSQTQSPQSLAQAQAAFTIANAQAAAGDQQAAQLLPTLSKALLDLASNQAATAFDLARLRALTAASLAATGNTLAGIFGLTIPKLATGTNAVPKDMLALIHAGEAVVPAPYNPALGAPGVGGMDGTDLQAVVDELAQLRTEQRAQANALAQLLARSTKLAERWDIEGMPEVRSA